ncbi:MAG: carbonic anhydrase [Acidimicrobiales bacterium]
MSDTWNTLLKAHRATAPMPTDNAPRHEPKAAILACSDARVPPSVVFGQPAGSLFIVRIAGNTAVPSAIASLDYAVANLGVDLIVVMGHTSCGAVAAASAGTCGGHLEPVVAKICDLTKAWPNAEPDQIAALNVAKTMETLAEHPGPVGLASRVGQLEIQGAIHNLRTGQLETVAHELHQSLQPLEAL